MLTSPLSSSEFFAALPVKSVTFRLGSNVTFSENEAGEVIPHGRGVRLWQGEVFLDKDVHEDAAAIEALISYIEEVGGSFMLYDPRVRGPFHDQSGSVLGAMNPRLSAVESNMSQINLDQLPAGYVLSRGDYVGFAYGANPTRHALHRVVNPKVANGSGLISGLQVVPKIREGVEPSTAVTLLQPVCKAVLLEAEYGTGRSILSDGGVLRWQQTLR